MAGKALKLVGINCDLIMSRQVLDMPARVCSKGIFDCQIQAFIMLRTYIELRKMTEYNC